MEHKQKRIDTASEGFRVLMDALDLIKDVQSGVISGRTASEGFRAFMDALDLIKDVQAGVIAGDIDDSLRLGTHLSNARAALGVAIEMIEELMDADATIMSSDAPEQSSDVGGFMAAVLHDAALARAERQQEVEYRLTRRDLYRHDCIGRDDVGARQGHYVFAASPQDAADKLRKVFPGESFDVQTKHNLNVVFRGR